MHGFIRFQRFHTPATEKRCKHNGFAVLLCRIVHWRCSGPYRPTDAVTGAALEPTGVVLEPTSVVLEPTSRNFNKSWASEPWPGQHRPDEIQTNTSLTTMRHTACYREWLARYVGSATETKYQIRLQNKSFVFSFAPLEPF